MHIIEQSDIIKVSSNRSYGNYKSIVVLNHNDLTRKGIKKLRGYSFQLILIPKEIDLELNKELSYLLIVNLTPSGLIKRY